MHARSSPKHFRRNRQYSGVPRRGLEEAAERFRRRQLNLIGRMYSASLFADERTLEMNSQDFCAGFVRFVLPGDVAGDSLDRTDSLVSIGGYAVGWGGTHCVF